VFLNFVTRIGCWPKILYSDGAGEFISRVFKTMFLARGCHHIIVPKGEHHAIGKAESAVAELDKMTRATIHDANLPFNVWDFVVDHMILVDSMTTYATDDPSKTIFESVYSAIPSFDSLPPVGCFGVRLECEKPSSYKLGSKNTSGIFLGYSFLNGVYGAVLLTGKGSYVVGKQQMAFDVKYFPLQDCGKTNPHLSTLYKVLGRTPRPAQFTNTSTSDSSKSDSEDDGVQPSIDKFDPREQAGGVTTTSLRESKSRTRQTMSLFRKLCMR
jgi:hypothetical protein